MSCESWTVSDAFWEDIDDNCRPPAVVLSGANTHDVKLLEDTLDHIVVLRPEADKEHPQNLCLDAGYTGGDERCSPVAICPIFVLAARKRRNWNATRTSGLTVGSLRPHTLF